MFNSSAHLNEIIDITKEAGSAIMLYWEMGTDVTHKDDGSPVTLADDMSEEIITNGLSTITPNIPIIAEELFEAGRAPNISTAREYWLVDPLDGTKEFIKGTKDFTINIGLIRDGVPVFGLVYLPASDDVYYGGEGIGAFLNGQPIASAPYDPDIGLTIVGNRTSQKSDLWLKFMKDYKIHDFTTRGSSLKFCLIADGSAHLYPRFVPTYEWDTCAAHAILLQTDGDIIDYQTRQRLQYGKPNFHNGNLITATNQVLKILNVESS